MANPFRFVRRPGTPKPCRPLLRRWLICVRDSGPPPVFRCRHARLTPFTFHGRSVIASERCSLLRLRSNSGSLTCGESLPEMVNHPWREVLWQRYRGASHRLLAVRKSAWPDRRSASIRQSHRHRASSTTRDSPGSMPPLPPGQATRLQRSHRASRPHSMLSEGVRIMSSFLRFFLSLARLPLL